jgi:hypothetical protein
MGAQRVRGLCIERDRAQRPPPLRRRQGRSLTPWTAVGAARRPGGRADENDQPDHPGRGRSLQTKPGRRHCVPATQPVAARPHLMCLSLTRVVEAQTVSDVHLRQTGGGAPLPIAATVIDAYARSSDSNQFPNAPSPAPSSIVPLPHPCRTSLCRRRRPHAHAPLDHLV